MKLLLIMYSGSDRNLVPDMLDSHNAGGYSELTQVHGAGRTGRREGTRAATYRIMDNLIVEATEQVDEEDLAKQLGLG